MDALRLDAAAELALQPNMNFAAANQIAAHGSLNLGVVANDSVAVQIAFVGDDQATARPDRPAVIADDPVVLEINVSPAKRTDRRCRTLRDLPFTDAFEAVGNNCPLDT
jgi:hypothetical protein